MADAIHQEVVFNTSSNRLYEALTDSKQFSKVTGGAPTEIDRELGGAFSCFGGMISGRMVELVPNQLIVQAWRVKNWPTGVYSIVKFELTSQGSGTKLILDHTGFPADNKDHLESGWKANYWEPLEKFLA